MRITRVSPRTL